MFGDRLKQLRQILRLTQEEFCEKTNITRSNLSRYESEKQKPSVDLLESILCEFNTNMTWLLTGEGEMFLSSQGECDLDEGRLCDAIGALEQALYLTDRTMEPERKAELVVEIYKLLGDDSVERKPVLKLIKEAI